MSKNKEKKAKTVSTAPVRENLESLAVAVALAVFLKFFAVEAYKIPTPSMQPTLMGDQVANIYDRLLVDKTPFLFRDPNRWEIAVFKYPMHQAQNYIKRIWGMPGEWLTTSRGDVWKGDDGQYHPGKPHMRPATILRKPLAIQEHLWLTVFNSDTNPGLVHQVLKSTSGATCRPQGEYCQLQVERPGGMVRYFQTINTSPAHGYSTRAARLVADQCDRGFNRSIGNQTVSDLKISVDLIPDKGAETFLLELRENQRFRAEIPLTASKNKRKARLLIADKVVIEKVISPLPQGSKSRVELLNYDDRLCLLINGEEILRHDYRETPFSTSSCSGNGIALGTSQPGKVQLLRLAIDRDIYYTDMDERSADTRSTGIWMHLNDDEYLMLGDNSDHSADSRAWQMLSLKDPATGKIIKGNSRLGGFSINGILNQHETPTNGDWNPVLVPSKRALVFTDYLGEEHVLRPDLPGTGAAWIRQAVAWVEENQNHQLESVCAVPRKFILGKALAIFWPVRPMRVDLID